jgi:23S rRNA pseudouridine1911/1915/1917 synthase
MDFTNHVLEILFEDDQLIVLAKPAGLPTANAPRGTESVFTLLQNRRPRGAFLGVVSRLDAPVSGVLIFAKTRAAAADLSRQFRERSVEKAYVALVEGRFPAPLNTWVDWQDVIERDDRDQEVSERSPVEAGDEDPAPGREAHVRARVVRRAGEVSLVELEPSTGRRHQLRLQLSRRRCPIVGDRRYGGRIPLGPGTEQGIALHARSLAVDHPLTAERLRIEAPLPAAWSRRFPAAFQRPRPSGPVAPKTERRLGG